ncbi:sugar phosphate isomerase/epimerase family protein [Fibrisoma limi]|nr:TIM barrel protein [Fibrisoma limi]
MTALDVIIRAKSMGVQAVQYGDNLPLHLLTDAEWQVLRQQAKLNNIEIQVGMRGLTPNQLKTYIKLAWEAQSPFIRVVIDDGDYKPSADEVIDIIRDKLPILKAANVILAIENHDRFKAAELWRIASETSLDWVGFCVDTTNSFGAGESVWDVLSALNHASVVNLHIKDFRVDRVKHKMGFRIEGCEPGTGMLQLDELLLSLSNFSKGSDFSSFKLNKREYPIRLTLEQWPPFINTIGETVATESVWAEKGIKWINETLTKLF